MQGRKNGRLKVAGDPAVTWEFYRSDGWRWRQVDARGNVYKASLQGYRHLLECVATAKAEGYTPDSNVRFANWPA